MLRIETTSYIATWDAEKHVLDIARKSDGITTTCDFFAIERVVDTEDFCIFLQGGDEANSLMGCLFEEGR